VVERTNARIKQRGGISNEMEQNQENFQGERNIKKVGTRSDKEAQEKKLNQKAVHP